MFDLNNNNNQQTTFFVSFLIHLMYVEHFKKGFKSAIDILKMRGLYHRSEWIYGCSFNNKMRTRILYVRLMLMMHIRTIYIHK